MFRGHVKNAALVSTFGGFSFYPLLKEVFTYLHIFTSNFGKRIEEQLWRHTVHIILRVHQLGGLSIVPWN